MMTLHVMFEDDLIEHENTEDCVCGPTTAPMMRHGEQIGWWEYHHALRKPTSP